MFGIITLEDNLYILELVRIAHIFNNFKFAQNICDKNPMLLQYFK